MSLDEFIKEWFDNEDWWFNATAECDAHLTTKYEHLLDETSSIPEDIFDSNRLLKETLLFDQLPRHVFRHTSSNHIIQYFLQLALKRVHFIDNETLTIDQWCFAQLPLRHTYDPIKIYPVMHRAWKKMIELNGNPKIHRFLKATYERCPVSNQWPMIKVHADNTDSYQPAIHQKTLHFCPFDKPKPLDEKNPIVQTVIQMLMSIRIPKQIIMSLSGGSDSMVTFHILHHLKKRFNFDLKVVTVNYCNRETAYDEEAFAVDWATSMGYPAHVRRIEEIKKQPCMKYDLRNIYESYTRNVRYNTYKNVMTPDITSYVAMGHNKDDCLENIFQNISHQGKYDNLNGMSTLTYQDGIPFFRPLLQIPKDDIVQYAQAHNLPYLPNSTPAWCHRGKIRNQVVPCMNSWNPLFIPGMHKLASLMEEMHKLAMITTESFVKQFEHNANTYTCRNIDVSNIPESQFFWNLVFKEMVPDYTISVKSLNNFIETFGRWKKEYMTSQAIHRKYNLHKMVQVQTIVSCKKNQKQCTFILEYK
jgi:tRNA(Ile)-lysidine synthetase-like protein